MRDPLLSSLCFAFPVADRILLLYLRVWIWKSFWASLLFGWYWLFFKS